jgi:hypothetical protein
LQVSPVLREVVLPKNCVADKFANAIARVPKGVTTGLRPQEDFMEDYDDGVGQAHQEDLLRQQEIEEDLGLFSPVYVLSSQQLTAEIFYFKSMEVI